MGEMEKKILIADDNDIVREFLTLLCSRYDLSTQCVTNGLEAVNAFEKENFAIIFMDLEMPVMGGLEATRVIRKSEREREIVPTPIIAISGTTMSGPHRTCIEAGMDGFLSKPIVINDMFEAIKKLIPLDLSPPS